MFILSVAITSWSLCARIACEERNQGEMKRPPRAWCSPPKTGEAVHMLRGKPNPTRVT